MPHCLTTFASVDATTAILRYNNNLTSEIYLWGSNECGASALHCSFYFH